MDFQLSLFLIPLAAFQKFGLLNAWGNVCWILGAGRKLGLHLNKHLKIGEFYSKIYHLYASCQCTFNYCSILPINKLITFPSHFFPKFHHNQTHDFRICVIEHDYIFRSLLKFILSNFSNLIHASCCLLQVAYYFRIVLPTVSDFSQFALFQFEFCFF